MQDYRDYGPRQISYGFNEVLIQILATEEAGGAGFMLWDPTLLYRTDVLALFAPGAPLASGGGFCPCPSTRR